MHQQESAISTVFCMGCNTKKLSCGIEFSVFGKGYSSVFDGLVLEIAVLSLSLLPLYRACYLDMLNATIPQVTCELLALLNILQFRNVLF